MTLLLSVLRKTPSSCLVLVLALALGPTDVGAQSDSSRPDAVDAWIEQFMTEHRIPGAAVAILEDGVLVKARGFGLANVEHSVPVSTETVFQSGSLGKQFTAAAILLLAEDGRLLLEDPITDYLDDAPPLWNRITIRELLGHTSGLPSYDAAVNWRGDYSESELISLIAEKPLIFEPGTRWSYSNSGYVVLGVIVSRVTGSHWGEFLTQRVFAPSGMATARVISEADIVRHRASGYRLEGGVLKNQEWVSPSLLSTGDGALYLSIMDLAHWDQALRRDAVLSEPSRTLWWTPVRLRDGTAIGYGFGWDVTRSPNRARVEHGGSFQGFRAYLVRYEEPAVSVALLINLEGAPHREMAYGIATAYRPELADPEPVVESIPQALLNEYTGVWVSTPETLPAGDTLTIRADAGGLLVDGLGDDPVRYESLGANRFAILQPDDYDIRRLVFVPSESGFLVAWLGSNADTPITRLERVR